LAGGASRRLAGTQRRTIRQPMRVGGWVRRQGRKVDRRRKPEVGWRAPPRDAAADEGRRLVHRQGRKVDLGREPEIGWRAAPKGSGSRRKPEVRSAGNAGKSIRGASRGLTEGQHRCRKTGFNKVGLPTV